jgi:hypothetical protein
MKTLNTQEVTSVVGGHVDVQTNNSYVNTALFILSLPHIVMHIIEMTNYFINLYQDGCENVNPRDKVGQFLICPFKA